MLNILIADSDYREAKRIENMLYRTKERNSIFIAQNCGQIRNICRNIPLDVALVSAEMKDYTGLRMLKEFDEKNYHMNIIIYAENEKFCQISALLHASGYITKPVTESKLMLEMNNLRYPVNEKKERTVIHTFGKFDIYVDNQLVKFEREKSKQMLAYLVDREGAAVDRQEIAEKIFPGQQYTRSKQQYMTTIINSLRDDLRSRDIEDILIYENFNYAIDVNKVSCDLYDYKKGRCYARESFAGKYMEQYEWAEKKKRMMTSMALKRFGGGAISEE